MKEYVFTLYGRRHAARQKTPEGKPLSALYNTDTVHTPRRKTPEGNPPLRTLQYRHRSRSAAENAGRQASLRTLQHRHRSHTAAENVGRSTHLHPLQTATPFTLRGRKRRNVSLSPHFTNGDTVHAPRRKRLTADTTPLFASTAPVQQKKRRMTAWPPLPPKNLRRPLIAPKNTAIFTRFFFDTSPGYAAESPCFRHKHSLRPKYFFCRSYNYIFYNN